MTPTTRPAVAIPFDCRGATGEGCTGSGLDGCGVAYRGGYGGAPWPAGGVAPRTAVGRPRIGPVRTESSSASLR